ncbi:Transmembrane protein 132C [Fukomys damarensis]|uniref:Transmembrane protein 132C n=1 Tax=Fukomys damarensis TaxID=885580 RepID=A0A091CZ06_FUKDA|nr:Transmembrane protein 132C [Fukomys damarensis]
MSFSTMESSDPGARGVGAEGQALDLKSTRGGKDKAKPGPSHPAPWELLPRYEVTLRISHFCRCSGSLFGEVVQMNFEIASFSSLSGTQPITWQVEYPRRGTSSAAVSEVFVSQQDLVGIVPLAVLWGLYACHAGGESSMHLTQQGPGGLLLPSTHTSPRLALEPHANLEQRPETPGILGGNERFQHLRADAGGRLESDTEILNTAILTGKTVAMPVRVVSVEEHGAVTDVSEQVECVSTDEDVIKVSGHCDYIFVNGREVKGKTDVAVNFVFRHLSAPLQVTVWAPRLPLHIDVSDTELSQIKGWRVPLAASGSALVADFVKLEVPRVASLQEYGVLAGREVGMTTVQVLSPLSDSILAEKTVTVLDDKVSVTELAIQLVAGLSVSLYPYTEHSRAITAVATAEELLRTPKQEAVVSTWLQFSDGSVTPLDIYDSKDFSLAASSLDEAVVSVSQPHSPHWPIVVAEGTGQGPLVRVDMSIAESCQKSKRRSVLAVGFGNVRVKFGQSNVDAGTGATEEEEEQAGAESENRSSDRRQKGLEGPPQSGSAGELKEGALWRAGSRAKAQPEGKAVQNSHPSGDELPHTIPLDFSNFPGHLGLPGAGAGLQGGGLVPTARGLSDLEIGMYALLGVFCLAILVFLINCATFALKFRRKQVPLEGQASVTHLHDWVWLGNEAELLESMGNPTSPPEEHTTAIDHGPGHCRESELLLVHWAVGGGAQQEPHPLASQRKRVQFATFPAIPVPPVGGSAVATSILGVH